MTFWDFLNRLNPFQASMFAIFSAIFVIACLELLFRPVTRRLDTIIKMLGKGIIIGEASQNGGEKRS